MPDYRVGVMADPGVPERIAASMVRRLADKLSNSADTWRFSRFKGHLPVAPDGTIPITEHAPRLLEQNEWDFLVYLSDLPRFEGHSLLVYEMSNTTPAMTIFVPGHGALFQVARVRRLIERVFRETSKSSWPPPRQRVPHGEVAGPLRTARVLSGMVKSNRPGRMFSALSGCFAAGVASGAFGIFFGSVWPLSDVLPALRLMLISVIAIVTLTAWLLLRNRLWVGKKQPFYICGSRLDNASTILTVGLSVTLIHILLFAALFILTLAVVDKEYFASQVGHEVGVLALAKLAWFSGSLGTLAGALGSNFDSRDAIEESTYSERWNERRRLFEEQRDQERDR